MARFFIPRRNIREKKGIITGAELEHLRKVLRLRPGDRITLFDDEGWEHEGFIQCYTGGAGEIEILTSYQPGCESSLDITLAQALGKGDKMDWVVEKATELGVQKIVTFLSAFTVPKPDEKKSVRRRERWEKIALGAVKQSGRSRIPEILWVDDFGALIRKPWPVDLKLLFWEKEALKGLSRIRDENSHPKSLLLVLGPEGGFSADEAAEAVRYGFQAVGMGKRILRTETAAIAALAIVQFLWGDIG